jgi:hypothetical protein
MCITVLCAEYHANTTLDHQPPFFLSSFHSFPVQQLLILPLPSDPASRHHSPDLNLSTPQVIQLEALKFDLLALPSLLPNPHLLFRSVPLGHHPYMIRLADLDTVFGVHRAVFALEFGIPQCNDIPRPDLVILLRGSISNVAINNSAIPACAHGEECISERLEELLYQSLRSFWGSLLRRCAARTVRVLAQADLAVIAAAVARVVVQASHPQDLGHQTEQ